MEYGTEKKSFDIGRYGSLNYHQWLHPLEGQKSFTEDQVEKVCKLVRPGTVAIDIGAHTGDTTLPMMVAAGKNGCVMAWEPNPHVYKVLIQNCLSNASKSRVIPVMAAATEGHGEFTFHYTDPGACNGGFAGNLAAGVGVGGNNFSVEVIGWELRNYLRRNYVHLIENISFIKIDAEGHDKNIIKTLPQLISEIPTPPLIQTELYEGLNLSERKELFDAISSIDYVCYDFVSAQRDLERIGQPLTEEQFLYMPIISGHDLICKKRGT
jgi:FkbM family methyltransferase